MSQRLGDLMFRLGADVSGFKDSFRDAVEVLETTGEKAIRVGAIISKAFDNLGGGDASAKLAARAKSLQASFELLEKAYKDGKITAQDYARAQEGLRVQLEKLTDLTPKFDRLGEALRSVKVDGSQFEVSGKIAELRNNLSYLEAAYKSGKLSAEDFARAQKSVAGELDKLAKADYTAGVEKLASQFSSAGLRAQEFGRVLSVGVTAPLVAIAGAALKSAADFQALENGLRAVTKEAGPLEAQLARLREVAKLPGLGFREAIQGSINLQAAGFSAGTAERALKAFGNALVTVGKGRADLDGVILALTQIAAKGKISAQEINQLGERLPQIRVAIKDAFGEGFNDADAFKNAGIGAQEFIEKIIQQFERLPKAAGGFKNDLENLRDSVDQTLSEIGKALIPVASQVLQTIEPLVKGVKEAAKGFAELPQPVQTALIALTGLAAAAGPALYAFGGIARGLGEVTPLLARLASSGVPAGQALGAVSGSATLLAGSLVALGAALTGIALYDAAQGASELVTVLGELSEGAEKVNYQLGNAAANSIASWNKNTKDTGSVVAGLLHQFQEAGSYIGDHFWEYVFPPAGIGQRFRDLAQDVKELTGRFPELEAAARRSQKAIADAARAQAQAAMDAYSGTNTQKGADQAFSSFYTEKAANLQAVKVAEELVKNLKKVHASKEDVALATQRLVEAQRKLHPELKATGDAVNKLGKQYHEAKPKAVAFTEAQINSLEKLRAAREALMLANGAAGIWEFELKTGAFEADALRLDESISRIISKMHDLTNVSREVQGVLGAAFQDALKDANALEVALEGNGVKSSARLQDELTKARERHKVIEETIDANGRMIATQVEYDQSLKRVLEAERALAVIRGESTAEIDVKLATLNARLVEHGVNVKGVKDSWSDFGREVSTIVTNFTQDIAKTLFDGTKDWGAKFTALWKDLGAAVTATFIQPVTAALTKFINTTIAELLGGKGLGGIKKSLADISASITGLFGGGGGGQKDILGNPMGSIPGVNSGGGGGAASSAGSLTGAVNLLSGAVSAISSVVGNFQFAAMNKSLDIIVKHTLQAANDIANLRADEWLREAHLMAKLDDVWKTLLNTFDYLGGPITEALRDISSAVAAGTTAVREVEAGVEAPIPVLERLISAVSDGCSRIVAAIQAGGIGAGSGGGAGESPQLIDAQMKLRDLADAQNAIAEQLPADILAALKSGQVATGATDEQRALIQRYNELHDAIVLLTERINSLRGPGAEPAAPKSTSAPRPEVSSGAVDPVTGSFDPSKTKSTIVAIGGGTSVDVSGVVEAIASLYEMLAKNWAQLFELLGKSASAAKVSSAEQAKKTEQVEFAEQETTIAVDEAAKHQTQSMDDLSTAFGGFTADVGRSVAAVSSAVAAVPAAFQSIVGEMQTAFAGDSAERERAALSGSRPTVGSTDAGRPRTSLDVPPAWYLEAPRPMDYSNEAGWKNAPNWPDQRPHITFNVTGNNFRNHNDIDYLVDQLESIGIRR